MKYKDEYYSCEEHIEVALDDFVDKFEKYPILEKDDTGKCEYCDKQSVYLVKHAN